MVRDSAGIQIVESAAPAWSEGSGWRVAREPRLRIGMVEGDSRYEFSRIVGGVRLSDGRIAILDAGSAQIRFFDGSGRYLASTGRSGGGPGEFAWPFALFRAPGDSLVAWDGSWAQLLFDPEGRFVRQNTLDRARLEIGPDYILAVERDELDVEYVVLFDLLKRT